MWPTTSFAQAYDQSGYYMQIFPPWRRRPIGWWTPRCGEPGLHVPLSKPVYEHLVFPSLTPIDTVSTLPFGGWDSYNVLDTAFTINFSVVASHGTASRGHTLLANYTFEDNNLSVHDFSGSGNDMSTAWFVVPPTIVTNDAAAGMYAGGLGGSGLVPHRRRVWRRCSKKVFPCRFG